jgi:tetratricopeptide (TPR) repeat protein
MSEPSPRVPTESGDTGFLYLLRQTGGELRDIVAGSLKRHPLGYLSLALFAISFFIYLPSLNGKFLWDDDTLVHMNPLMRMGFGEAMYRIWIKPEWYQPDYFPLTSTAFWFQFQVWGQWAGGYRIVNALLHAWTAVLLWRLLRTLGLRASWFAALVFAIHPVNVESVAWVSELKNLLALLFVMPAMNAYFKHDRQGAGAPPRQYLVSLGFYLLALLAKASVVAVPPMLVLYLWWKHRGRPPIRRLVGLLPFFAMALVFGLITIWFQHSRAIAREVIEIGGPLSRTAGAGMAFWFYLSKALVPVNLMTIYPVWDYNPAKLWQLGVAAAVPAMFLIFWRWRNGWGSTLIFGMGCYLLSLAPALGFVKMSYMRLTLVADHFQHLALPALVALVVCGSTHLFWDRGPMWRNAMLVLAAWVTGWFMTSSWIRAAVHYNEDRLWTDSLGKHWWSWQCHSRLGTVRANEGRTEEAIRHYAAGIESSPQNGEVQHNLGAMYAKTGRNEEALECFRKAAKMRPDMPIMHQSLMSMLVALKRPDDLAEAVDQALRDTEPDEHFYRQVLSMGGYFMLEAGENARVETLLRARIDTKNVDVVNVVNLGVALYRMGRKEEAVKFFEEGSRLAPGAIAVTTNLINARKGGDVFPVKNF